MKVTKGYIYFIQSDEGVKIGYTVQHPNQRLKQLQTGSLSKLRLLHFFTDSDCKRLERRIHFMFRSYRARIKGEWFTLPIEVINWIKDWRSSEDIK